VPGYRLDRTGRSANLSELFCWEEVYPDDGDREPVL